MKPIDSLEITVLVDNVTDSLSSAPGFVESEFAFLRRHGMKWLSGSCLCCAAHGLSCLVTARVGDAAHTVLFDTGPDDWVFERNATRLGVDLGQVGAIVLSHGHWDHTAATPRALQMIRQGNKGKDIPVYLHPEMFAQRAMTMKDGQRWPAEPVPGVAAIAGNGGVPVVTRDEQVLAGSAFVVSGEIPRVTAYEKGFPGQQRQKPDGTWELDEIMADERYLAVNVAGKGQVIFTACSHAGLVNVLTAARARHPDVPVWGVFGGFHLAGPTDAIIPETVADLKPFDLKLIAAAHCTGWRAVNALAAAYGDAVVPSAVGKVYRV